MHCVQCGIVHLEEYSRLPLRRVGPGAIEYGLLDFQASACTRQPNMALDFCVYFVL